MFRPIPPLLALAGLLCASACTSHRATPNPSAVAPSLEAPASDITQALESIPGLAAAEAQAQTTPLLRMSFDSLSTTLPWGGSVYPQSGCAPYQPGIQSYCYTFDGTSESYVSIPDNPAIDLGASDFSLACWVKTASTKTINTILDKRDPATGVGYHFVLYSGRPLLQLTTAAGGANLWGGMTGPAFNDGKWHHLAVTADRDSATGLQFYADGVLIHTLNPVPYAGTLANASPLLVAKHKDFPSSYFEGSLDDLRLNQGVATASEVKSMSGVTPIEGGQRLTGAWSTASNSVHIASHYGRYYTFTLPVATTVRIGVEGTVANALFLMSGAAVDGPVLRTTITSGRTLNSAMVIDLNPGTYTLDATTYDANTSGTYAISLGYFWADRLTNEIEAKWECDEAKYAAMVAAFANGAAKYGYTAVVRWSGVPRRYTDIYYDVPWGRVLKPAHHAVRFRALHKNTSGLGANPSRAELEAASWNSLEWYKVQYKSTPIVAKPLWFRAETSTEQGQVTGQPHAEQVIRGTAAPTLISDAIRVDHPTLNLAALNPILTVVDYRYRIELQKNNVAVLEVSLDRMDVNGEDAMQCELELIKTSRTQADIWETYRVANLMQAEFGLVPTDQAKGEY